MGVNFPAGSDTQPPDCPIHPARTAEINSATGLSGDVSLLAKSSCPHTAPACGQLQSFQRQMAGESVQYETQEEQRLWEWKEHTPSKGVWTNYVQDEHENQWAAQWLLVSNLCAHRVKSAQLYPAQGSGFSGRGMSEFYS